MKIFQLINRETGRLPLPLSAYGLLSAGAGCAVIVIASSAALQSGHPVHLAYHFAGYLLAVGLYLYSFRNLVRNTIGVFDRLIASYKARLAKTIRNAEVRTLEKLEPERVRARINGELTVLEQTAEPLATSLNTVAIWLCSSIYLGALSLTGLVVVMLVSIFAFRHNYQRLKLIEPVVRTAEEEAEKVHGRLSLLVHGLRETRLDWKLDQNYAATLRDIVEIMIASRKEQFSSLETLRRNFHLFYYLLLGVVAFVLPLYIGPYNAVIAKFASILIFALGPLALLTLNLSRLNLANVAIRHLEELESDLRGSHEAGRPDNEPARILDRFADFKQLSLKGVEFRYGDSDTDHFCLGPLDLKIERGQTVFIVGGNGTGKSSLSKILLGLYLPSAGSVCIDDAEINDTNRDDYRWLFTAVFATPHLFTKPYGMDDKVRGEIPDILKRMGLTGATEYQDGMFNNLGLSSGQRMRLALGLAMAEERPINVFDEPAANLDNEFRDYFYRNVLPSLKLMQKTTIVITHDDRYFHLADRVIEIDEGRVVSDEAISPTAMKD